MIDEWKNPLNDPFFFAELYRNDLHKPQEYYHYDQGCALLVLVYDFFFSNFDFVFLRFFPLVSKYVFKSMQCSKVPSVPSSKKMEGAGTYLCTCQGPIFVQIRKWRLWYLSVIFLSIKVFSICLTLHSSGYRYRCFQ